MESAAEARQRAKQEYMVALEEQRRLAGAGTNNASGGNNTVINSNASDIQSKLSKREKMLEEKKLLFLNKQKGAADNPSSISAIETNKKNNNAVSGSNLLQEYYPQHQSLSLHQPHQVLEKQEADHFHSQMSGQQNNQIVDNRNTNSNQLQQVVAPGYNNGFGNIGAVDEKEIKKAKQAEYARELQNQMANHQQSNNHSADNRNLNFNAPQHVQQVGAHGYNNGFGNIGAVDEKEIKIAKQAEYARELQNQMANHQQSNNHSADNRNLNFNAPQHVQQVGAHGYNNGFGNIGAVDEKEIKRAKQAEYARELQNQMANHQQSNNHSADNRNLNFNAPQHVQQVGAHGYNHGFGNIGAVDEKEIKRAKQAEYARELQNQMAVKKQTNINENNSEKSSNHVLPSHENFQQHHLRNENNFVKQPSNLNNMFGNIGATDDKEMKKQKQAEYAKDLERQMAMKLESKQLNNFETKSVNGQINISHVPSGGSVDAGEWVMGPLGNMVRKTLEVGNRGAQKAFNQKSSPTKNTSLSYLDNNNFHLNQKLESTDLSSANVGFNKIMDVQAERDLKAKQMQQSHAMALEMQIKERNQRLEAEKLKLIAEEERLQKKLEKDQKEAQDRLERENLMNKARLEDERKKELALQIENKRLQKETELESIRLLNQKEDERIAKEQMVIRQREEREIYQESLSRSESENTNNSQFNNIIVQEEPKRFERNQQQAYSIRKNNNDNNKDLFENPPQLFDKRNPPPVAQIIQSDMNESPKEKRMNIFDPPTPPRPNSRKDLYDPPTPPVARHNQNIFSTKNEQNRLNDNLTPKNKNRRHYSSQQELDNNSIVAKLQQEASDAKKEALLVREELQQLRNLIATKSIPKSSERKSRRSISQNTNISDKEIFDEFSIITPNKIPLPKQTIKEDYSNKSIKMKPKITSNISTMEELDADIFDFNKSIKSESRFVYPDGRSFKPGAIPVNNNANDNLNMTKKMNLMENIDSESNTDSKLLLPSETSKLKLKETELYLIDDSHVIEDQVPSDVISSNIMNTEMSNRDALSKSIEEFDVDRILRINKKKLELLSNIGTRDRSINAPDEIDMLLSGFKNISSRPSTAMSVINKKDPNDSKYEIFEESNVYNVPSPSVKSIKIDYSEFGF